MKNNLFWLRLSYWVGAVIDAAAAVLLMFPDLNASFSGYEAVETSAAFRAASAPAAALMWGWTFLLIWADRRPWERRGVLALTIFPALGLMIGARFQELLIHQAAFSRELPFFVLQFGLVALFAYSLWVNRKERQGAGSTSASRIHP